VRVEEQPDCSEQGGERAACLTLRDWRQNRLEVQSFHGMVTASPQMRAFFTRLERVARSEAAVLIRGETGTGKELVARAIHDLSSRRDGPFRAINCATLTPEMMVSELFGHVRGAFTGAVRARKGAFELADGGTLFLDEIAELPLDLQARLLRVIQEQNFVPLGGTEPTQVDVRILSATHKALRREAEAGRFREDLMYRVRVVPIFLPRLAERENDVAALTWNFIDAFNARGNRQIERISVEAMRAMCGYGWPGNIRELRNAIEHAFAVGEGPLLMLDDLPPEFYSPSIVAPRPPADPAVAERAEIEAALQTTGGRKAAAAEQLGMSRSTLWRKMRELGLQS